MTTHYRIEGGTWHFDVLIDGEGSGSLSSHGLKETTGQDHLPNGEDEVTTAEFNAAIEGLESLVLAHACEGVNIEAKAYALGVITAVETMSNRYS
jgi:hypothetical protein